MIALGQTMEPLQLAVLADAAAPLQLALEPVPGRKKKFEYVFRPVGRSYPDWRSRAVNRVGAQICVTDWASPDHGTPAGCMLARNLLALADATYIRYGGQQRWPVQEVDIFKIPQEYLQIAGVVVANSPARHARESERSSQGFVVGYVDLKQNAFYSMCWQTTADVAVVMTFSLQACSCLNWWTDPREQSGRILMVTPAWFDTYRPRLWLSNELAPLADSADTMVAVFVPTKFIPGVRWVADKIDVAVSIANWISLQPKKTIVTLGTHTAELELDLLGALRRNR